MSRGVSAMKYFYLVWYCIFQYLDLKVNVVSELIAE